VSELHVSTEAPPPIARGEFEERRERARAAAAERGLDTENLTAACPERWWD
jgi:hypothetical protein